jgi:hypothetical protein
MPGETIKILSWNIQKFNSAKMNDKNFMDYVAGVIIDCGADFVGIMEIVGWVGQGIKNSLVSILHNKTGVTWAGEESEMTPSKPNEQYIFLWKQDPVAENKQRLYRIIGDVAFDQFFARYNYSQADKATFWQALLDKGYIEDDFTVPDNARAQLEHNPLSLDLPPTHTPPNPPVNPTDQQKRDAVMILLADSSLGFPLQGSRPPYLASTMLETSANKVPCLIALFHAPGPTGTWPMIACSMLGLVDDVIAASKGVVMGDFNVTQTQSQAAYEHYRWANGQLESVVDLATNFTLTSTPFQRLTGPNIVNLNVPPRDVTFCNYQKVFDNTRTSLTTTLIADDNVVADDTAVNNLRSSEYDNFFVRGFLSIPQREVLPVIAELIPKQIPVNNPLNQPVVTKSITTAPYNQERATLAAQVFNQWWDQQNARGVKKPDIINPSKLGNPITKIPNNQPTSLRQAHYIYRYSISDHLPIFIELEYA